MIRPLIYTEEKLVKEFIKGNNITVVPNPCEMDGKSKRQYIKDLLTDLKKENREIKNNIRAINVPNRRMVVNLLS